MTASRELELLAGRCIADAKRTGARLSTAESLTAGMVSSSLASIPGASAVLRGGAVTYCDEMKHRLLGVELDTLRLHTAVSEQTAREMARGSRRLFSSDIAVSLTGYAGPDGGGPDAPAGTVFIAVAGEDGVSAHRYVFSGSREEVREQASCQALRLMISSMSVR